MTCACACLAAGGNESPRCHNISRDERRERGRAKMRSRSMQRAWHYSSKKSDSPSSCSSDAAKRGVGARVRRGRGSGAGEDSRWGRAGREGWEGGRGGGRLEVGGGNGSRVGHAPLPGASLQVRDLCPHSLQIEQRCGLFFRDGPPPLLLPLLLRAPKGTLPDAGSCRGETGLPTCSSCLMRLGGLLTPVVSTPSMSARIAQRISASMDPPVPALSAARPRQGQWTAWLGGQGLAQAHEPGPRERVLLWCGDGWAHRLGWCRPVSGACR